jgi:hypothetical protein
MLTNRVTAATTDLFVRARVRAPLRACARALVTARSRV